MSGKVVAFSFLIRPYSETLPSKYFAKSFTFASTLYDFHLLCFVLGGN